MSPPDLRGRAVEEALRDRLARGLAEERGLPDAAFEVVVWVPVLWSGWEDDHGVVLYRFEGEREARLWVADQRDLSPEAALESKAASYEREAARTRTFLAKARAEGLE